MLSSLSSTIITVLGMASRLAREGPSGARVLHQIQVNINELRIFQRRGQDAENAAVDACRTGRTLSRAAGGVPRATGGVHGADRILAISTASGRLQRTARQRPHRLFRPERAADAGPLRQ